MKQLIIIFALNRLEWFKIIIFRIVFKVTLNIFNFFMVFIHFSHSKIYFFLILLNLFDIRIHFKEIQFVNNHVIIVIKLSMIFHTFGFWKTAQKWLHPPNPIYNFKQSETLSNTIIFIQFILCGYQFIRIQPKYSLIIGIKELYKFIND